MRPRLTAKETYLIEAFAKRTGGEPWEAREKLLELGFAAATGTQLPATAEAPMTLDDDAATTPGRAVFTYLPARWVEAIKFVAAEEQRSISFTVKSFIREALVARGLWKQGRMPVPLTMQRINTTVTDDTGH